VLCGRALEDSESCNEPHGYLELIPSAALGIGTEHFISVSPFWIDISRIRTWPKYCDEQHYGSCYNLNQWQTIEAPRFLVLIDVDRQCLTQVSKPVKYIALSYVWGRIPDVLESTLNNFSALQNARALELEPWASRMPSTVRDAIYLTKEMGERYLWVDRLCIIQDDDQHKAEQLSWMSSIYANSYFTIIAADGNDANYGLPGIRKISSPRSYHQPILEFSQTCYLMQAPESETQFNMKEWHKRGWTFQERTLSNRNLVFFQGKVFWECCQSIWAEDIANSAPNNTTSPERSLQRKSDRYRFEFFRWPDLYQYSRLVSSYNNRLLSYPSDGLQAFSAVIDVMCRSFEGGFIHGIPKLYFDIGLLWRPNTPTKRRCAANARDTVLPSWSWVGWEGNVVISCLKKSHILHWDGIVSEPPIEIYPMVTWSKTHKRTGEKHPINNSYHQFQRIRTDCSIPLQAGWSRVKPSNMPLDPLGFPHDFWVFRHDSIPEVEFIHPVPIPPRPLTPGREIWDGHLNFRTSRCFLFSGPLLDTVPQGVAWSNVSNDFVPKCLAFNLICDQGKWAGMIYSNFSHREDAMLGESCEIIIISGGKAHIDKNGEVKLWLQEWQCIDDLQDCKLYEFYNVLWIERDGDIASRKALGRVWKNAWDRQQVEEIDVILG
jgi:hypothetical protein